MGLLTLKGQYPDSLWSALTCQRFGRSRPVAANVALKPLTELRDRPRKTKVLTGQRPPKEQSDYSPASAQRRLTIARPHHTIFYTSKDLKLTRERLSASLPALRFGTAVDLRTPCEPIIQ